MQLPVKAMGRVLHRSRIFNYLTAATPGLREMVTMGKVWELAQDRRRDPGAKRTYDAVIVDAPATGHGVAFMQTPGNFRELARVGPIARQAAQIERTISDHSQTGIGIVALGEEMAVNESIELESALSDPGDGFAIDRIFCNGLYPQRFSAPEVELIDRLRADAGPAAGPLEAAAREAGRAASQREQLDRLRAAVDHADHRAAVRVRGRDRGRAGTRARDGDRVSGPASMEDLLAGTSICVCVGSGGVGKTTTSAAIAAGMAARGKRVAVLTIDPAKRLADSLGLDELANEESRVDPALFSAAGVDPGEGELWATMLDAKATFDEMVARYAPDRETEERILANRIYQEISGALAGSQEYMAMEKLYEIHEQGGYDLLVLDTPPSRNALDFLDAPQRLVQFIEGRSLRLFLRPAGVGARIAGSGASVVFSVLSRLTGLDLMRDLSEFFGATRGMIGGFRERAERVSGLLAAEGTRFVIVCGPAGGCRRGGGVPAREAARGRAAARRRRGQPGPRGGRTSTWTCPRPRRSSSERIGDAALVERILAAYAAGHALAERDAQSIAALSSRIGEAPLIRVPELTDEVHDLAGLLSLDPYLFGRLSRGAVRRRRGAATCCRPSSSSRCAGRGTAPSP